MPHINLLPWREKQRQQQKYHFVATLLMIVVTMLIVAWVLSQLIEHKIKNNNARNHYLQQEIAILDVQIAQIKQAKDNKKTIEKRIALIEQLSASRNVTPMIFKELAALVPSSVVFKSVRRAGNTINIDGTSSSNNHLSDFIRALDNSTVFTAAELSTIASNNTRASAMSNFVLSVSINPTVLSFKNTENGAT